MNKQTLVARKVRHSYEKLVLKEKSLKPSKPYNLKSTFTTRTNNQITD